MSSKRKNNRLKAKKDEYFVNPLLPDDFMVVDVKDLGGVLKDTGKTLLNTAVSPVEMVIGKNFYNPTMDTNFGATAQDVGNVIQGVGSAVVPGVANALLPGSGLAIQGARAITNPMIEDQQGRYNQAQSLGSNIGTFAQAMAPIATMFQKGGPLHTNDKIYVTNPEDPELQKYKDSLQMYNYTTRYNQILDEASKLGDPKARKKYIENKWYNTPDYIKNLELANKGFGARTLDKTVDTADYPHSYVEYSKPKEVVLVKPEELETLIPKTEATVPLTPQTIQPKVFTGFHNNTYPASMQVAGYSAEDFRQTGDKSGANLIQGASFAMGGNMYGDMTEYNEGGSHETNPYGGIPIGEGATVEQGEVRVDDYIFSDRLKPEGFDKTFAELAKKINKKYSLRTNDPPSQRARAKELEALMQSNEEHRIMQEQMEEQMDTEAMQMYGGDIEYKNGGIYIKPSKRGSFTAAAKKRGVGVQEFASRVLANKEKYSTAMVKKANFARNFGGKKANGGDINDPRLIMRDSGEIPVSPQNDLLWMNFINNNPTSAPNIPNDYMDILQERMKQIGTQEGINEFNKYVRGQQSVAYGGKLKYQEGGDMNLDWMNMVANANQAVTQGLPSDNYFNTIRAAQMPKDAFGNPIVDPTAPQPMNLQDISGLTDFSFGIPEGPGETPVARNPIDFANYTGTTMADQTNQNNLFDPNARFGAKELGLIASGAGSIYNIAKGMNPATTEFERYTPEMVSLQKQRDAAARQAAVAKSLGRENVRQYATTSGQALSNLSAQNAAINENQIQNLLQSYQAEEAANVGAKNQAGMFNTQIGMQETIANEQNKAMADSLIGMGLTDLGALGTNYLRDKSLQQQNTKFNDQQLSLIKQMFPNYTIGTDPNSDQWLFQFVSGINKNSNI